jgi:hypothetical protein
LVSVLQVREALARAGVPAAQPFLDFHETFAGYVFDCVLEIGVLGLAHPEPAWLVPNEVEAWEPEPPDRPLWKVRIADVNPTFWWVIDEEGTHYTASGRRIAGSFARYIEQQAFWEEFTGACRCWTGDLAANNLAGRLSDELLPRLRSHLVPDLSDVHSQVALEMVAVSISVSLFALLYQTPTLYPETRTKASRLIKKFTRKI